MCGCIRVISDLTCGHEDADRATVGVSDGMEPGVYATLRPADQTAPLAAGSPFLSAGSSPCDVP